MRVGGERGVQLVGDVCGQSEAVRYENEAGQETERTGIDEEQSVQLLLRVEDLSRHLDSFPGLSHVSISSIHTLFTRDADVPAQEA